MGEVIDLDQGRIYAAVRAAHAGCGTWAVIETPEERSLWCAVHGLVWRTAR